jgi:hypothetical protein
VFGSAFGRGVLGKFILGCAAIAPSIFQMNARFSDASSPVPVLFGRSMEDTGPESSSHQIGLRMHLELKSLGGKYFWGKPQRR